MTVSTIRDARKMRPSPMAEKIIAAKNEADASRKEAIAVAWACIWPIMVRAAAGVSQEGDEAEALAALNDLQEWGVIEDTAATATECSAIASLMVNRQVLIELREESERQRNEAIAELRRFDRWVKKAREKLQKRTSVFRAPEVPSRSRNWTDERFDALITDRLAMIEGDSALVMDDQIREVVAKKATAKMASMRSDADALALPAEVTAFIDATNVDEPNYKDLKDPGYKDRFAEQAADEQANKAQAKIQRLKARIAELRAGDIHKAATDKAFHEDCSVESTRLRVECPVNVIRSSQGLRTELDPAKYQTLLQAAAVEADRLEGEVLDLEQQSNLPDDDGAGDVSVIEDRADDQQPVNLPDEPSMEFEDDTDPDSLGLEDIDVSEFEDDES